MNSKLLLTIIAVMLLGVGATWLFAPGILFSTIGIEMNGDLDFMGRRYSAYILGLVVTLWMARDVPNTKAKRALMIGCMVALALTCATSLYGSAALGLNMWMIFAVELLMVAGFVWVLFIKPEPVVD
jgi:hypothetical protein